MRIVVTGSRGQVSSALQAGADAAGVEVLVLARPAFDLARQDDPRAALAALRPDVVVSAAAYTAVDLAQTNQDEAHAINGRGAGILAQACAALDVPILHLSTDYVFDGTKPTPYTERDPTGPTGVYGASKLEGEKAVAAANARHCILRTAWVYDHANRNFLTTMLRLAQDRREVSVVADQIGSPGYAADIAQALFVIARHVSAQKAGSPCFGTFHLAGGGDTSWAGFAAAIFGLAQQRNLPFARVRPIASSDYPTPTRRPANSRLDCSLLFEVFGLALPHWHDGLARCMARLGA